MDEELEVIGETVDPASNGNIHDAANEVREMTTDEIVNECASEIFNVLQKWDCSMTSDLIWRGRKDTAMYATFKDFEAFGLLSTQVTVRKKTG